jgi:hypothetical protein
MEGRTTEKLWELRLESIEEVYKKSTQKYRLLALKKLTCKDRGKTVIIK